MEILFNARRQSGTNSRQKSSTQFGMRGQATIIGAPRICDFGVCTNVLLPRVEDAIVR